MMDDEILADLQAATAKGGSYVAGAVVDNVGGAGRGHYVEGYATRVWAEARYKLHNLLLSFI